jgi:hypothetical protein
MKKIIISLTAITLFSSSFSEDKVYIYCKPDINACIWNLHQMQAWVQWDYEDGKMSEKMYKEYRLVLVNTRKSLEMILDNKGQCDTVNLKPVKLKY